METKTITIEVPEGYVAEVKLKKEIEKRVPFDLKGKPIEGYWFNENTIKHCRTHYNPEYDSTVFASEDLVKSALAMAQISLLMEYDKRYGGAISDNDWCNSSKEKWCITREITSYSIMSYCTEYHFLAFHTADQAELFLHEHEDLVRQFYMM